MALIKRASAYFRTA